MAAFHKRIAYCSQNVHTKKNNPCVHGLYALQSAWRIGAAVIFSAPPCTEVNSVHFNATIECPASLTTADRRSSLKGTANKSIVEQDVTSKRDNGCKNSPAAGPKGHCHC